MAHKDLNDFKRLFWGQRVTDFFFNSGENFMQIPLKITKTIFVTSSDGWKPKYCWHACNAYLMAFNVPDHVAKRPPNFQKILLKVCLKSKEKFVGVAWLIWMPHPFQKIVQVSIYIMRNPVHICEEKQTDHRFLLQQKLIRYFFYYIRKLIYKSLVYLD